MKCVTPSRKTRGAEENALCEVARGAREEQHPFLGSRAVLEHEGLCERVSHEENAAEMFESETRGPANDTRGRAVLEHEGLCERVSHEENAAEMFESETRGPANDTRGPTNDTGASKRHITGDRTEQAGAKRSIDPTSAFGLRSESKRCCAPQLPRHLSSVAS
jgi:hypothetical protein